jgi:2-oxoglutarate ferredoxin oxidoreductase subunit alpha
MIRPITLWPFPTKAFAKAKEQCKSFISVELNMGQMIEDVKLAIECKRPVTLCSRTGGMIPTPEEVVAAIENEAKGGAN